MTALAEGHDLTAAPAVADWLRHPDAARARACNGDVAQLVRGNVIAQLVNLATHPAVARGLADRTLTLHGWVFDIATGTVDVLHTENVRQLAG